MKKINKAFFLDRDGTINVDYGYIARPQDVKLLDGAAKAIRKMNRNGYKVIVVTNQSGVARGYFDLSCVRAVNEKLQELLRDQGAYIDRFYVCPHHPQGKVKPYNIACQCRKPGLLLYRRAQEEFSIDMQRSYAAGDRLSDIRDLHLLGIYRTGLIGRSGQQGHYSSLLEFTEQMQLTSEWG